MISRRRVPGFAATLSILWVALGVAACVREPLPRICPDIEPGALVITEIRGPQSGADTYGQWIEVFNASAAAIDLAGMSLHGIKSDGAGDFEFLVRDHEAIVEPGAYVVLGGAGASGKPFVTYEFEGEEGRDFYAAGIFELVSCDVVVDHVLYRGLPELGTLSLDGALPPDADLNDDSADPIWCVDQTPPQPGDPMIELGLRGTPAESNRPCL